jgi:thiol-disulfide isomerase/thioredoxin
MIKKIYIYIIIAIAIIILAGIYVDKNTTINTGQPLPVEQVKKSESKSNTLQTSANKIEFSDYGAAPEFKTGNNWLNSLPLTMKELRGKVVLIDFWTYTCINCIRTLPYVTKWYDTYKDNGFVVIGVHTPEFAFEKDANNVKQAISHFNIHYPVVQDNDYAIWNSYNNQYWPAEYLINQKGEIVKEHFGEGDYDKTENAIRYLLGLDESSVNIHSDDLSKIGSPEMYFGTDRLQNLTPNQTSSFTPKNYTLDQNLSLNNFSLGGSWQFSGKSAELLGSSGQINLKFHSGKVFIVASSQIPATLTITVDGKKQPSTIVQESKLYTLFDSQDYSDHVIEININQTGFEAFTFTFG